MSRVLFLAAHPDDIEYYMGGTVVRHGADGDECVYAVMSRGEYGVPFWKRGGEEWLKEVRTEEARRGAEVLGMREMRHFDVPDGDFPNHEDTVRAALRETWDAFHPDIVYLPEYAHSFYPHADHLTVGRLAHALYQECSPVPVFRFYHTLKPTQFYSVAAHRRTKAEAIRQHKSQFWVVFPIKVVLYGLLWPLLLVYAARAGSFSFEFYREA